MRFYRAENQETRKTAFVANVQRSNESSAAVSKTAKEVICPMKIALLPSVVLGLLLAGPGFAAQAPKPKPSPAAAETPSQFYLRYRGAVQNATTLDEVLTYWRSEMADDFKQRPPEQRADLAALKRIYGMVSDVTVAGETVGQSGGATVTLKGTRDQKQMTGTAYLVKQNGEWKLFGPEGWE
jgi:hypothetical protein